MSFLSVKKILNTVLAIKMLKKLDLYQSCFCANFSADSCLVQLTDFILRGMDKRFHTGMILVDLQKAFGTLDLTILLQKMECIGFNESVIKWFQSHFSNRKFFATLENVFLMLD